MKIWDSVYIWSQKNIFLISVKVAQLEASNYYSSKHPRSGHSQSVVSPDTTAVRSREKSATPSVTAPIVTIPSVATPSVVTQNKKIQGKWRGDLNNWYLKRKRDRKGEGITSCKGVLTQTFLVQEYQPFFAWAAKGWQLNESAPAPTKEKALYPWCRLPRCRKFHR